SNPYGNPVIEIVAPERLRGKLESVFNEYDINPQGHGVFPQNPSFEEQYPEVSDELVSYQFYLEDPEDLASSGYALDRIFKELRDEPVIYTTAPSVQVSIP
ncbi:MAG: hypothetical protein ABEI86_14400, partial [Halobacteriaceae archaeon]